VEVKINKEILDYTESIFLGLSLRQCFFSFLGCFSAIMIYFICINKLGTEITSWCCMIGALPFAALGFIKFQGMNTEQILVNAIRSYNLIRQKLVFKPKNLYYECLKENILYVRKESMGYDKKLQSFKKIKQR